MGYLQLDYQELCDHVHVSMKIYCSCLSEGTKGEGPFYSLVHERGEAPSVLKLVSEQLDCLGVQPKARTIIYSSINLCLDIELMITINKS